MQENEDTEQNISSRNDFYRRALKSISASDIEGIIAKVLGDTVGREYKADLKKLDFNPFEGALLSDATEITILLQRPNTKNSK